MKQRRYWSKTEEDTLKNAWAQEQPSNRAATHDFDERMSKLIGCTHEQAESKRQNLGLSNMPKKSTVEKRARAGAAGGGDGNLFKEFWHTWQKRERASDEETAAELDAELKRIDDAIMRSLLCL